MKKIIVSLVALGSLNLYAKDVYNACGGEGPGVWAELPDTSTMKVIPTTGKVKEVLYWEGKNTLVYRALRNDRNLLIEHNLDTGKNRNLGTLNQPMSNVIDPQERFILTRRNSWIMDTRDNNPEWYRFASAEPIQGHLFWNFRDLYSLASTSPEQLSQKVSVNLYEWGQSSARSCTLKANPNEKFFMAQGSAFPWVYIYKTEPSQEPGRTKLTLIYLRVNRNMAGGPCETEEKVFMHPIRGQVNEVHFFSRYRVAIRTNSPYYSLMWWNGEKEICKYYPLGDRQILVPNHSRYTFFTYDANQGLEMFFPKEENASKMHLNHNVRAETFDSLWLNSYGDRLYTVGKPKVNLVGEGSLGDEFIAEIGLKAN